MVRLFYITSILILGSLAAQAQKTVIEENGVVKSVHKERGKKQIHITYYDNGQKKSWMKVTPEWVKEKEWYRDGQKKKHVVYSQVSFTADYKKYNVWDEEGNKIENKSLPDEAILVADYTEVGAANSEKRAESREQRTENSEQRTSNIEHRTEGTNERHPEPVEGRPTKKDSKVKDRRSKVEGEPYERRTQPGQDNMKSDVTFHTSPNTNTKKEDEDRESQEHLTDPTEGSKVEEVYIERVDVEEEMASLEGTGGFRMYVVEEPENVLAGYQSQSESEFEEVAESQVVEEVEEKVAEQELEFEYAHFEPVEAKSIDLAGVAAEKRPPLRLYQTDGSDYETTLAEADMAFDNGEYDLAKEYYNKAAEKKPKAAYVQDRIRSIQLINWMDGGELVVLDEPIYGENNPIPVDAPFPEGLVYRVQLVAAAGDIPYHIMPRVAPIAGMTVRGTLKRYMAGEFRSFEDAQQAMHKIHRLENSEAFIIAFDSGEYISVNRALAIEKDQSDNGDEPLLTSY